MRTGQTQPARPLTGTNSKARPKRTNTSVVSADALEGLSAVAADCTLRFSRSARGSTSSRGRTRSPRAERSSSSWLLRVTTHLPSGHHTPYWNQRKTSLLDGTRFNLQMTETEIPDYYEFLERSEEHTS